MSTDEPDDLLETGHPLPGWVRVLAAAVAVLGLGYLGIRALDARGPGHPVAAPQPSHSPVTAPPLLRFPGGPRMTAAVGCGAPLPPVEVSVAAAAGSARTGLQLLVGGGVLQRVDFDTGQARRLSDRSGLLDLRRDEWFDSIVRGAGTVYATTATVPCDVLTTRILAVHGDHTSLVTMAPSSSGVLADATGAWAVRDPPHVLAPLTGGRQVRLPDGFVPVGTTQGLVVGNLVRAMDPTEIAAVDARTGRIHATTGAAGVVVAVGHGRVYWVSGCTAGPCPLHSAAARGGRERSYRLAGRAAGSPGLMSPDGRRLALVVHHPVAGTGGRPRRPALDGVVAVLDVHTGQVHLVPGLALATAYSPSFAFAPGGWLVVGYEHDGVARLVAWRAGLARPVQSRFRATSPAAPPIVPAG